MKHYGDEEGVKVCREKERSGQTEEDPNLPGSKVYLMIRNEHVTDTFSASSHSAHTGRVLLYILFMLALNMIAT